MVRLPGILSSLSTTFCMPAGSLHLPWSSWIALTLNLEGVLDTRFFSLSVCSMSSHLFFCGMRTDPRVLCTLRKHSTAILSSHTVWSLCILKVWMTSFSFWCHLRTLPNLTPWIVFCSLTSFRSGHLSPQSPLSWLLWRYKVLSKAPLCLYRPTAPAWLLTWSFFLHRMALAPRYF